jgi:acetyl esterase/lipase
MTTRGLPFSVVGLAACLVGMTVAPVSAQTDASIQSTGQQVVTFSPESPVPIDVSPEAQALFLRMRPQPGAAPVFIPDCTDPGQRSAFLAFRASVDRNLEEMAKSIRTPYAKLDTTIDGVGVTWLTSPKTRRRGRLILYLHGGAYIFGTAHSYATGLLNLAEQTGMRVLGINYRLAPETPFPGGLEDCKTVYHWLLRQGYDPKDIVVLGESAGGGLALAMMLSLRDEGAPMPAAMVLLSPWADLSRSGDTDITLAPHSTLCWDTQLAAAVKAYVGKEDPRNPLISPVYAEYTGMPPMLIHAGTREILLSDATRVNHQALKAGVAVTLDVWDGMFHVHQHSGLPESHEALDDIAAYIQKHVR